MRKIYDIIIVGTGVAGCFAALHFPKDLKILMITKAGLEESDSFLAQGGICVLKNEEDYDSFFEDTMRAGHYENRKESVDIMIRSSRDVINELIGYGVDFAREDGELLYTREGAHSTNRILFHKDITGQEITSHLLEHVKKRDNIEILTHTTMIDILERENCCEGILLRDEKGEIQPVFSKDVIWACGGIGGIYKHSTNFPHLTGDALAIAKKHGVRLQNVSYVQIHPTTLYTEKPGRSFLVSESVRGEGALLYNKKDGERFADELQPRDVLTAKIQEQMEKDQTECVWLSMKEIPKETILEHFPNIYKKCMEEGYDVTKEPIPVVPAQHYFMGGVYVDSVSRTTMEHLYAAGETSCNGVHGANRLASNSLLESLVFAKRAALDILEKREETAAGADGLAETVECEEAAGNGKVAECEKAARPGEATECEKAARSGKVAECGEAAGAGKATECEKAAGNIKEDVWTEDRLAGMTGEELWDMLADTYQIHRADYEDMEHLKHEYENIIWKEMEKEKK